MARYIDADIVHAEIEKFQTGLESNDDKIWRKNKPYYKGLAIARGIINDIPTADVVPKSEVAREIFAELDKALAYCLESHPYAIERYNEIRNNYIKRGEYESN